MVRLKKPHKIRHTANWLVGKERQLSSEEVYFSSDDTDTHQHTVIGSGYQFCYRRLRVVGH